ncbi:hypothetical protein [Nitrosovibrio sp. Nv4]|uniref:hypothetical protein n=1 Tax=Nitrosovibrio sp. Nv4 TaxID=1945880 RepID=UPI000BCF4925|nr:hypothetical protein [Nitrosovibrio sp. Nv4]SOD42411.1 hypothetical protein SAMN06298226_2750 [Nitrosovibrio sp. Nv4]
MKTIVAALLAFSLPGIAQAQGWTNPYSDTAEQLETKERKLRMELMEKQSKALDEQRRMMRSQDLRNDLQSLEMLGDRSGGIRPIPPIGY